MNIRHHKVLIHGLINVSCLSSILNVFSETEHSLSVDISEILSDDQIWVWVILSNVIDVDSSSQFNDQVKSLIESVVEITPESLSLLESTVKDYLLDG